MFRHTSGIRLEESCTSIVQAIMQGNKEKYMAASKTPFLSGKLGRDIGTRGDGKSVHQIINGTYLMNNDIDQYTRLCIQQLSNPSKIYNYTQPYIFIDGSV